MVICRRILPYLFLHIHDSSEIRFLSSWTSSKDIGFYENPLLQKIIH